MLILKVTTHPRIKCTKHDLQTIYSLSDLLDFVEDIEVLEAAQDSFDQKEKARIAKEASKRKS